MQQSGESVHTFGTHVIVEPLGRESPRIQPAIKAIDDERSAIDDDMEENKLLEVLETLFVYLINRDAVNV